MVVSAGAVYSAKVCEVFDSTRREKLVPGIDSHFRPVGYGDEQVVFEVFVSAPYREADVVAYYHSDVPTSVSYGESGESVGEAFVFSGECEQVLFVGECFVAGGFNYESSVVKGASGVGDEAACDSHIVLSGEFFYAVDSCSGVSFGQGADVVFRAGEKSSGEHFGKNQQVGQRVDFFDFFSERVEIFLFVAPCNLHREQGDVQVG